MDFAPRQDRLAESNPFAAESVDSSAEYTGISNFVQKCNALLTGTVPFSLELEDPLANCFVYNPYAPEQDPQLTVEDYARSAEEVQPTPSPQSLSLSLSPLSLPLVLVLSPGSLPALHFSFILTPVSLDLSLVQDDEMGISDMNTDNYDGTCGPAAGAGGAAASAASTMGAALTCHGCGGRASAEELAGGSVCGSCRLIPSRAHARPLDGGHLSSEQASQKPTAAPGSAWMKELRWTQDSSVPGVQGAQTAPPDPAGALAALDSEAGCVPTGDK